MISRADRKSQHRKAQTSVLFRGHLFVIGSTVKAFNGAEWAKTGDVGDNSQFYREAEIIDLINHKSEIYPSEEWVADVKWKHNGEISRGHFIHGLKLL